MRAENTFLRNVTILYAFYSKLTTFSNFQKKTQDFFSKNPYIFLKNQNFECFEKFYYFSPILRRICYNLIKRKFDLQTGEQSMLARLRELNWEISVKKTDQFERKILLSYN